MGRPKCEEQFRIDLARLRRNGGLAVGRAGTLTWSGAGQITRLVAFVIVETGLRVICRERLNKSELIDKLISFTTTQTAFGGRRVWFQCSHCRRRCRIVYGEGYRCRTCANLVYASQYEPSYQNIIDQADSLRRRVGAGRGAFDKMLFPPRPKGMHHRSYELLKARYDALVKSWTATALKRFRAHR